MCPDECSAELRMVSPVSLESRLSRPLEPLRSDLRSWKPSDGSRALGFLSSSWPFRQLPLVEVPASFFLCAVPRFEDFDSPVTFILLCFVDYFKLITDFHLGPFVPKIFINL
ncbi:hypothetical protein NPIL_91971 [Nephila pilipes]|uniref:Uncharacterized protein n=1 Tax=Nephila pilipes TaxID=299642 RepID=A0A8X6NQ84_NEPPI|nr:hypothetical protein NPIL_91971 [Nephila pilipes]